MRKVMVLLTVAVEVLLYIFNCTMYKAWIITSDVYYYVAGELSFVFAMGLIVAWYFILRHDQKERKARE